ncbi:MFS family permease [Paenarthrobacter nitroguajacolicus]|uniref:MFS transporter n=1 Tax=Paenarthrobacter nitroguajacolicus TaxID=211146 RepID=UPI00285ECF48|nr:MFS transporter [Paenarthrobacter nitroguajacolicus]MDR6987410.1 MFS family permease [Paenarthrobacter nitroguajacolicus]
MSTMDPTAIETHPPASGRTAGKTQAVLLVAGSCMPVLGAVLLAPVLPTLNQVFADSAGVAILVPLVLTLPALFVALFSPLAGYVADRVGRKQLLVFAMIAYALFGTAPLWLDSLGAIAVSRAGVGIAEAAIMTCCTTLITDYYDGPQRNKYLGLQTMVSALAATAFFALGGALGSISWRTPFWLYAVSAVLVVPMIVKLREPAKTQGQPATAAKQPVPWRRIGAPAAVTLFGGIVFYALIVHLPYVMTGLGVTDTGLIGGAAAIASLATAAGAISFRFLARLGTRKLLVGAFGLAAVGLCLVSVATNVPLAILGAVVASAGTGVLLPTLLTWAVNGLEFSQRGRGTGIWTGSLFIGQFLTPIVLGAAAAGLGNLSLALGALGLACAVALLAVVVRGPRLVPVGN